MSSVVVKEGILEKCSRNRTLASKIGGKNYRKRHFKLFDNAIVEYYDGNELKGDFLVSGGKVEEIRTWKEFCFKITAWDGENIFLFANSAEDLTEWIFRFYLICSGKYRWYRHIDAIANLVSLTIPFGKHVQLLLDEQSILKGMDKDGYGPHRLDELLENYFQALYSHINRFVKENDKFAKWFCEKFTSLKIRIVPFSSSTTAAESADNSIEQVNFRTKFTAEGELEINYIKPWIDDITSLGNDLANCFVIVNDPVENVMPSSNFDPINT